MVERGRAAVEGAVGPGAVAAAVVPETGGDGERMRGNQRNIRGRAGAGARRVDERCFHERAVFTVRAAVP